MAHGAIEWVEIPAKDLMESPKFYETVFGWKINRDAGWEEYPMFMDAANKLGGGFTKTLKPAAEGGLLLFISVDEIESILPTIEKNGGKRVKEKTLISDQVGWWGSFQDPAGNTLGLFQSARKA